MVGAAQEEVRRAAFAMMPLEIRVMRDRTPRAIIEIVKHGVWVIGADRRAPTPEPGQERPPEPFLFTTVAIP